MKVEEQATWMWGGVAIDGPGPFDKPYLRIPFEYATDGNDGDNGPPVHDPLVLCACIQFIPDPLDPDDLTIDGDEEFLNFQFSLQTVIDDLINAYVSPPSGLVEDEAGRTMLLAISAAYRGLADHIETTLTRGVKRP